MNDSMAHETSSHRISLSGCSPTPLASYLKALGILRLVAEQIDPGVKGYWEDEEFVLLSDLNRDGLASFFLHDYQPTPLLAPWNGGSGFYKKGNETAWKTLETIKSAQGGRWGHLTRGIMQMVSGLEYLGVRDKPDETMKKRLLARLRSEVDERLLTWFDASVVLSGEDPRYPPLLGTGGNDGRLDFTSNYLQRLLELFDTQTGSPAAEASMYLKNALFAEVTSGFQEKAMGQFAPGNAGGPNASSAFEGASQVNPWDYVLLLEGSVLFAPSMTKKLQTGMRGSLSYPFTVRTSGTGSGAASLEDEASSRAEIWMPLWENPFNLFELKAMFAEGRVSLGRTPARDGLDFVRAVAKLGVDRGISGFQRYAFMKRSGKAFLATPLSRVQVRRNTRADIIDQLDRSQWLRRFRDRARHQNAPGRLKTLARRLEDALFRLAQRASAQRVQAVLRILGAIQGYLSSSQSLMDSVHPVPRLSEDWLQMADDASNEYRLALSLSGLYAPKMPMSAHMAHVDPQNPWQWKPDSRACVWTRAGLEENLFAVLIRRLLAAEKMGLEDKPLRGWPPADAAAVGAFLAHEADDRMIAELLSGFVLAKPPSGALPARSPGDTFPLPAGYCLLKPLFTPDRQLRALGLLPEDEKLPLPRSLPRLLQAGKMDQALEQGARRLRASGLAVGWSGLDAGNVGGPRLLAALMIPLSNSDLAQAAGRIVSART